MKLWVRLALVMAVVSIVPLLVTGLFAMNIATRKAAEGSQEILLRDATAIATFVETWTADQFQVVGGWMMAFRLGASRPEVQTSLLTAVMRAVPSAETVVLVDTDGVPVVPAYYATVPLQAAGELRDRDLGSEARAQALVDRLPLTALAEVAASAGRSRVAVGDPYVPPGSRVPSLPVASSGPFGDPFVLGAEVSLGAVAQLLLEQSSPEHAVALLTGTGTPVAGGAHPLVDLSRLGALQGIAGADSTTFGHALADGQEVRGAMVRVASTGWTVVVVEPADVLERTSREIQARTIEVLVVSSLLAFAAGAVIARSLSEPVQKLRDSALAVARGDLGRRVEDDRNDELGELAKAFNHMSAHLQHNQRELSTQRSEIEAFNQELQLRVDERTRELKDAQRHLVRSGQLAAVAEVGAGMAHELNNPLSAILGLAQLLQVRLRGSGDEAALHRIEEQASRCREVVAAMLRFSSGEVDSTDAPVVDMRTVLREVIGLVGGPFRQRGVALELAEPEDALPVRIDPVHGSRILAQVLNSLRAGLGEGAALRVSGRREGGHVIIELYPDRPVAMGGARDDWMASGMGLWVARRLLDQVGGRLEEPSPSLAPDMPTPVLPWHVRLPLA
jgi:signal transduction histidine kinase